MNKEARGIARTNDSRTRRCCCWKCRAIAALSDSRASERERSKTEPVRDSGKSAEQIMCPACKGLGASWNNSAATPCETCHGDKMIPAQKGESQ